jgi:hypothetical protein
VRDAGERIGLWGFEKMVFRRLRKHFSSPSGEGSFSRRFFSG